MSGLGTKFRGQTFTWRISTVSRSNYEGESMNAQRLFRASFLASLLAVPAQPLVGFAQHAAAARDNGLQAAAQGYSHDFAWEIGLWKTHLKRRLHPLTGSNEWVEYEGTTAVRKIWKGRANMAELDVTGPAGHIEGAAWRLYNPAARQWSLNFSNARVGTLTPPTIGEFKGGRGEFYSGDTLDGRAILVRFVISAITANSAHFEQSFSADGGQTWETNWIADDTRLEE
jgi:hypothetical protein